MGMTFSFSMVLFFIAFIVGGIAGVSVIINVLGMKKKFYPGILVPVGTIIGMMPAVAYFGTFQSALLFVPAIIALVIVESFADREKLKAKEILTIESAIVLMGLFSFNLNTPFFGFPPLVALIPAFFYWMFVVQVFKVEDQIENLVSTQTMILLLGCIMVSTIIPEYAEMMGLAVPLLGATCAFFIIGRPPISAPMGYIGAGPIGFIVGALMLDFAAKGNGLAAFVFPFLFFADSIFIFIRRKIHKFPFFGMREDSLFLLPIYQGAKRPPYFRFLAVMFFTFMFTGVLTVKVELQSWLVLMICLLMGYHVYFKCLNWFWKKPSLKESLKTSFKESKKDIAKAVKEQKKIVEDITSELSKGNEKPMKSRKKTPVKEKGSSSKKTPVRKKTVKSSAKKEGVKKETAKKVVAKKAQSRAKTSTLAKGKKKQSSKAK